MAFIEKTADSMFDLTNIVRFYYNNTNLTGGIISSAPSIEGAVICYGYATGHRRYAEIIDTDYNTLGEGKINFTHMIRMDENGAIILIFII